MESEREKFTIDAGEVGDLEEIMSDTVAKKDTSAQEFEEPVIKDYMATLFARLERTMEMFERSTGIVVPRISITRKRKMSSVDGEVVSWIIE